MYTPTQIKQLNYLDKMLGIGMRVGLSKVNTWACSCKDCREEMSTHCVEKAQAFIGRHEGHRTWIDSDGYRDGKVFLKKTPA